MKFHPDQNFLNEEAADPKNTVEGVVRRVVSHGKQRAESIALSVNNGYHHLVSAICHRLTDDSWRIGCVDLNIPALVHGHNGRPLESEAEHALALTRGRHFLGRITAPESHGRLLPGVGSNNQGFVSYLESMFQVQDEGHRLLQASHTSRRRYQQKPAMVCWGQSTRFRSVESDLCIYDKHAQRRKGLLSPSGIPGVRIELVLKNPERIAQEILATGEFSDRRGDVARTVTLATGYALVKHALSSMDGWGEDVDGNLSAVKSPTRGLILGLGSRIVEPFAVDAVIDRYRETCKPSARTLGKVEHSLRSYATAYVGGTSIQTLPEDFRNLRVSEVRNHGAESDYRILLNDWDAPSTPDPDIAEAWALTTFLPKRPETKEIIGRIPSWPQPWKFKNKTL